MLFNSFFLSGFSYNQKQSYSYYVSETCLTSACGCAEMVRATAKKQKHKMKSVYILITNNARKHVTSVSFRVNENHTQTMKIRNNVDCPEDE